MRRAMLIPFGISQRNGKLGPSQALQKCSAAFEDIGVCLVEVAGVPRVGDVAFRTGERHGGMHDNHYPLAVMMLDIYHALEHVKEIMLLLGYEGKTDAWTACFRRWRRMFKAGRLDELYNWRVKDLRQGAFDAA